MGFANLFGDGKMFVFRWIGVGLVPQISVKTGQNLEKQTTPTLGVTATLRPSQLEPVDAAAQRPGSPGHISEAQI